MLSFLRGVRQLITHDTCVHLVGHLRLGKVKIVCFLDHNGTSLAGPTLWKDINGLRHQIKGTLTTSQTPTTAQASALSPRNSM